jgi:hypothetical protein
VPAVFFYDVLKQEKIDDGSALNNDSNKIQRLKFSVFRFFSFAFRQRRYIRTAMEEPRREFDAGAGP